MSDRQSPPSFGPLLRDGGGISSIEELERKMPPAIFSSQSRESNLSPNGFSRCRSPPIYVVEKQPAEEVFMTDLKLPPKEGTSRPTNLFQPYLDVEKGKSALC